MNFSAKMSATTTTGSTTRNTAFQLATFSKRPEGTDRTLRSHPQSPPTSAMDRVRPGPGAHNAAIKDSVVGYAMPAANPPNRRPAISTLMLGANPEMSAAGIASVTPRIAISLRP